MGQSWPRWVHCCQELGNVTCNGVISIPTSSLVNVKVTRTRDYDEKWSDWPSCLLWKHGQHDPTGDFEGKYIEVMIELRKGIFISQRTYAEDLIEWNSVVHGKIYLLTSCIMAWSKWKNPNLRKSFTRTIWWFLRERNNNRFAGNCVFMWILQSRTFPQKLQALSRIRRRDHFRPTRQCFQPNPSPRLT